jgi:hypothetical protein
LRKKVPFSFALNKTFFKKYQGRFLIVLGGFKVSIAPTVANFLRRRIVFLQIPLFAIKITTLLV